VDSDMDLCLLVCERMPFEVRSVPTTDLTAVWDGWII
jgi:hypothetical protein